MTISRYKYAPNLANLESPAEEALVQREIDAWGGEGKLFQVRILKRRVLIFHWTGIFSLTQSLPYLQHIPSRPIDSFCIEEWVMHDKKLSSQGKSISSFLLLSCRAQCAVCHLFYVSKSKITRNPFACEEKLTFHCSNPGNVTHALMSTECSTVLTT